MGILDSPTPAKVNRRALPRMVLGSSFRGSAKIRGMASAPPYNAPLMSTLPTITQAGTATTGLTTNVSYTSSLFRWAGPVGTGGGSAIPRHYTKADGSGVAAGVPTTQVAFDFDEAQFDFVIKAYSTLKYRVWVNELAATATMVSIPSGTGTQQFLNVNLGSASIGQPRRIVVELEDSTNPISFYGLRTIPTASALPPSIPSPRVMLVGDSYGGGQGGNFFAEGYGKSLGRLMGWADFWSAFTSIGSTGLIKDASTAVGHYQTRLVGDVIPYSPDLVIIQGSLNDNPYAGLSQVGPALTTYAQALWAALPDCAIVATSPLYMANPPASYTTVGSEMQAAATALGIPFLDLLTPAFFIGGGKSGTPTGVGNADNYRNADGTHPTKEGHYILARIVAGLLGSLLGMNE